MLDRFFENRKFYEYLTGGALNGIDLRSNFPATAFQTQTFRTSFFEKRM